MLKLECLNECGCHPHEKRCEKGDIMHERDLDVMPLSDATLKRRSEEEFGTSKEENQECLDVFKKVVYIKSLHGLKMSPMWGEGIKVQHTWEAIQMHPVKCLPCIS